MAAGKSAGWLGHEASYKSKHTKALPTSRSATQYIVLHVVRCLAGLELKGWFAGKERIGRMRRMSEWSIFLSLEHAVPAVRVRIVTFMGSSFRLM